MASLLHKHAVSMGLAALVHFQAWPSFSHASLIRLGVPHTHRAVELGRGGRHGDVRNCCLEKKYTETVTSIIEALRGDALAVAMGIGIPTLLTEGPKGTDKLLADMKHNVFPMADQESKDLYQEGRKIGNNVLSRQEGEGMAAYCQGRRRW